MTIKNVLLFAGAATAHFGLTFPPWRADTLTSDEETTGYNQRIYPCANVPGDQGPTTDWPIDGGSLTLDLHHNWTYVFLNLGLGSNVTNFNVTLTPQPWNVTGKGDLCVPQLPLDLDVEEGQEASLQAVTVGHDGSALYNCANVRLVKEAKAYGGEECKTADGLSYYVVGEVVDPITSSGEVPEASGQGGENTNGGSNESEGGGSGGSETQGGGGSGAVGARVPAFSALGLAFAFTVETTFDEE
ncbi:uncharacterized protein DNG_05054 [Cephalotrichum gorgonifer]|uniref:Copper acquisition factor BIM1-like domain-containing protein n=1 Tax=Cephalotrichum gorgonifer TaxID=2041049 RepID=A0AAE8MX97_9PEZI|nr:uncharacterized protein DNG_05054 [Cephalotrichum gorgonifer]